MKNIILIITIFIGNLIFGQEKYTKITYKELLDTNNILPENNLLFFNKNKSIFIPNHKKWETEVKVVGGSTIYPSNTIDSIANKPRFVMYNIDTKTHYSNLINNDIEYIIKDNSSNEIKWEDTNDYKNILNHKCRKSIVTSEKGGKLRKYIVWYSLKDKSTFAPFKFNHPKGLVLELQSEDNSFHFIAEKINTISASPFALVEKYDFSKAITSEEYMKFIQEDTINFEKEISEKLNRRIELKKDCKNCN